MYLTNLHKYKRFKLDIKHLDVTPDDSLKNTIVNKLGVADDTKCIPDTINKIIELAGSGSGTTYEGTHGIEVNNKTNTITAKTDDVTIKVNEDGNLEAVGSGGSYTAGRAIEIDEENHINALTDDVTIGVTEDNKLKAEKYEINIKSEGGEGKIYTGDHGIAVDNNNNTITAKTDDVTIKVNEDGNLEAVNSGGISEVTGTEPIIVYKSTTLPNVTVKKATKNSVGVVQPDNDTITINSDGVISAKGGGGGGISEVKGTDPIKVDNGTTTPNVSLNVGAGLEIDVNRLKVLAGAGLKTGRDGVYVDVDNTTIEINDYNKLHVIGSGGGGSDTFIKAGSNVTFDGGTHVGNNYYKGYVTINASEGGGGGSDTFIKAGSNVTFDGGTHVGNNYYKGYVTINASEGGGGGSYTAGDGIYITNKNEIRVYKVPYNISWQRQLISCSTPRHGHYHGHQSMKISSSLGYYNGYLYATTEGGTGTEGSIYGGGLCSIGSNVGVYASAAIDKQTIYGYLYYGDLGSSNDLDPIEQEYYSQHPEEFRNQLSDSDKKWFNIHNLDIYSFEMENFTIKKGKIKDISELGWVWYRNTLLADSTGGMIVEKVDIHNLLVEGWNPNELGVHKVVVTNPIVPGDPTTFYMKVVE